MAAGRGPLRIFIGTVEIAGQIEALGAGFRALGHHVTTAVTRRNPFYPDAAYDLVLDAGPASRSNGLGRRIGQARVRVPLLRALRGHDVYVVLFGDSALPANLDFPVLARGERRIASLFLGSEIRHWSAAEQARAAAGLASYPGYREARSLDRALTALRMAELYAAARFFQPSYAELAMAPYQHLYLALDLERYECRIPDREVPVVVHAPSSRQVKGTAEILEHLEALRTDGIAFELRLLEGVPNREVLRELAHADVVVDELNESNYGMLSLEAMASGCAVAAGNRPDVVPLPPDRPVVHISPEVVRETLRRLLTDRAHRTELAAAGRPFVERHHSHVNVASGLLEGIERAGAGDHDYHPRFFVDDYQPPDGLRPSWFTRWLNRRVAARIRLPEADAARLRTRGLI